MNKKKIGLTLGKFAPLHKGHQYMIETALAEMDELVIFIYEADELEIPLSVRARWLKELYPDAIVYEAWDGPQHIEDTPVIREIHEKYIIERLKGKKITHFYPSEFYGEHISRALGAVNRQVDPDRVRIPVSATMIRKNPGVNSLDILASPFRTDCRPLSGRTIAFLRILQLCLLIQEAWNELS